MGGIFVYPKQEMLVSRTEFAVPRCVVVPKEKRQPLELQGMSRFREKLAPCRCVVPQLLPYSSREVLEALYEVQCFVKRVLYHVEAYALGSMGVNQHMRAMREAHFKCWDFQFLLRKNPTKEHYEAFLEVVERLFPILRMTVLPRSPEFGFVRTKWPRKIGPNGWFQQYKTLNKRLNDAGKSRWKSRGWWRIDTPEHLQGRASSRRPR